MKPIRFSLRALMLAMACFAVAAGWASLSMNINGGRLDGAIVFILLCPISGAAIGGGVGLLFDRFQRGVMVGLIIQLALFVILAALRGILYYLL